MRINIEITTANLGQFANIFLCYTEPETEIVKIVRLKVNDEDFTRIFDFTGEVSSVSFDFFLISTIVYGIDDLFERETFSYNGWSREFEVCFPVRNLRNWQGHENSLNDILAFLTGDNWQVDFCEYEVDCFVEKSKRWKKNIPKFDFDNYHFVSLFSGGLDSLLGVINELERTPLNKKAVFVSHSDGAHKGALRDQNLLLPYLYDEYPNKIDLLRLRIGLNNTTQDGDSIKRDSNQRSRSLLFLGIGCYVINRIPNLNSLNVPENGTISLNHPLTPSRVSTLSTRTTHPHFLKVVSALLSQLGLNFNIDTPFKYKTKGEMVVESLNPTLLRQLYEKSASCGKGGHKAHWKHKSEKQCGVCMPCIYRRASLHSLNIDTEGFGKNLLNWPDPIKASPDMPALFDYLKSDLPIEKIKRNLLVNGSIPQEDLNNYANVVVRSRGEILSWIRDKGSPQLKTALGIR